MAARSNMTTKFIVSRVLKLQKEYREKHKDVKNVAIEWTLGVIEKKGLPEIEDSIRLIIAGNIDCTEEQAASIYQRELDNGSNELEIFCNLCKDYCLDMPIHPYIRDTVTSMYDDINSKLEAQRKLNNLSKELQEKIKDLKIDKLFDKQDTEDKIIDNNIDTEDQQDVTQG